MRHRKRVGLLHQLPRGSRIWISLPLQDGSRYLLCCFGTWLRTVKTGTAIKRRPLDKADDHRKFLAFDLQHAVPEAKGHREVERMKPAHRRCSARSSSFVPVWLLSMEAAEAAESEEGLPQGFERLNSTTQVRNASGARRLEQCHLYKCRTLNYPYPLASIAELAS